MKHIAIPQDLQLLDDDGNNIGDPISFKHWLLRQILRDKTLAVTAIDALRANDIAEVIEAAGLEIALGDSDWEWVGKVVDAPTGGYPPMVVRQYVPFIKAYRNASDKSGIVELGSAALLTDESGTVVLKAE